MLVHLLEVDLGECLGIGVVHFVLEDFTLHLLDDLDQFLAGPIMKAGRRCHL